MLHLEPMAQNRRKVDVDPNQDGPKAAKSSTGPLNLGRLADVGWSLGWTAAQIAQVHAK